MANRLRDCRTLPDFFSVLARKFSDAVGTPAAFMIAFFTILIWGATGPLFHFSDTWQLVINTATTIVTFLMVFLIQNAQNRDAKVIQLKLDELIRGVKGARTEMVDLEDLTEEELIKLKKEFQALHEQYKERASEIERELESDDD